jgi:hypothetical protein
VEIIKDRLFPSVCLQSLNEEISANFGGGQHTYGESGNNFVFDIEGFRLDLAQAEFMDISRCQIKRASLFEVVKSYLIHYAFVETLQALDEESSSDGASL